MTKLNSKQKELYKRISRILWKDWDPIGVYNEEDEWDDEYDSYVPHLFRLAIEGKDAFHIAASLNSTATQNMGMGTDKETDLKVANLIINAKNEILD
ncbi:hypothetical protein [Aliikangiella sp. G2MR2-5]|uniref:hypothetical protein n=1 Tax=Aliikangiella sp. G2MR2-5 TaxID=2788943 RepID=UPI0018AA47D6|nr:hypothetical protein [Aliikangiella sp. G2MR2-5]